MADTPSQGTPKTELTEKEQRVLGRRRLMHMIVFVSAAGVVATAAVIVSLSLEIAKREPEIDTWTLLSVGVLTGLVGSVMRALAHGTGSSVDYYGKLVGVSAAVLTLWGLLVRMPVELSSLSVYVIGGIALFVTGAFIVGLRMEKAHNTRKTRALQEAPTAGS